MTSSTTLYTLHPFGDEWLWDEDSSETVAGQDGLCVPMAEVGKVAEDHRAKCIRGDEAQRAFFAGMWFTVCDFESGKLAALISPQGEVLDYADPATVALYERIGTDGEWPKP